MGNAGRKKEPPKRTDDTSKKKPPAPREDDEDYEDGDIASPKKDRYGTDDEPL